MTKTATILGAVLALACFTAAAAGPAQAGDLQTLQAIAAELRELRLALERSNTITARLQLAFQRSQAQERRVDALSREADEQKQFMSGDQSAHNRMVEQMN